MKKSMKAKYEDLVANVKGYIESLKKMRAKTSLTLPAYGQPGEENKPGKSQPNVVFVKDLMTQVMTADNLGYNTHLTTRDGELSVTFVEKTPPIPFELQYP